MDNFLELPHLVQSKMVSFLKDSDVLNLRKVSHSWKSWVDNFGDRAWNRFQVTFRDDLDFEMYAKSGLKIPNLFINTPSYWGKGGMEGIPFLSEFSEQCGSSIKRLRVEDFFGCVEEAEFNFFNSLSNLQELRVNFYILENESSAPARFPPNLKNIKFLKIKNTYQTLNKNAFELMRFCSGANTLRMPCSSIDNAESFQTNLEHLMDLVKDRQTKEGQGSTDSKVKVKSINLKHFVYSNTTGKLTHKFLRFAEFSYQNGVRLMKVRASLLNGFAALDPELRAPILIKAIDQVVLSLHGFTSDCLPFGWSNLESLSSGRYWEQGQIPVAQIPENFLPAAPTLPKLRSINLDFHSQSCSSPSLADVHGNRSRLLHQQFINNILFPDQVNSGKGRTGVEHLILNDKFERDRRKRYYLYQEPDFLLRIVRNVPNLRKLEIIGWEGNEAEFAALFNGLQNLEQFLVLECGSLNDNVLIGEDPNNPVFLKLTRLRKVSLDSVPGISDRALEKVFARMSLKEFQLLEKSSDRDLFPCVTLRGIAALAKGPFGQSVSKFICKGFSLADGGNISEVELPLNQSGPKTQANVQKNVLKKKGNKKRSIKRQVQS